MIEKELFYYRTDEFRSWRLYLSDISYHKIMIHDNHDLIITRHPEYIKTYSKIIWIYYWSNMRKNIWKYIQECDICQHMKFSNQSFTEWLYSLSIPEQSWESIDMDYLRSLLKSISGKDIILIIIDWLMKMMNEFILMRNILISWIII